LNWAFRRNQEVQPAVNVCNRRHSCHLIEDIITRQSLATFLGNGLAFIGQSVWEPMRPSNSH